MRASLVLPMLVLTAAVLGSCSPAAADADMTLAGPSQYMLLVPDCWEPDIVNTTAEPIGFAAQATTGSGRTSEILQTGPVEPLGRGHLHLFADAWEENTLHLLMADAQATGCELTVWVVANPDVNAAQSFHGG